MDALTKLVPGGVGEILGRFQSQGQDPSAVTDQEAHASYGQVASQLQPHQYRQGAEVTVTLEIEASLADGASDQIVRTVTENSRILKFTSQGFESD